MDEQFPFHKIFSALFSADREHRNGRSGTPEQSIQNARTADPERWNSRSRMQIRNAENYFSNKVPTQFATSYVLKICNVPLIPLEAIEMTASNLNSTPGGYVWKQIVKINVSYIVKKVQCVIVLWFRITLKITTICSELLWDLLRTFVFKALAPFTNYGIADSIILHFSLWFTNLGSYLISGPSIS